MAAKKEEPVLEAKTQDVQAKSKTLESTAEKEKAVTDQRVEEQVEELVEVRVLLDCELGHANTLVSVKSSQIKELKALCYVDDEPSAIAYLKEGK